MAISIRVGDKIPEGTFSYVPYTAALDDLAACGVPTTISTKDWAGKKVVLISVPGAFTPTCHVNHIPPYLKNYEEIKSKGVDVVAVVAANDPFVMSGWSRVEGFKDKVIALTDTNAAWFAKLGLSIDLSAKGLGIRTARSVMILEDLVVKYIRAEEVPSNVESTGVEGVLAAL